MGFYDSKTELNLFSSHVMPGSRCGILKYWYGLSQGPVMTVPEDPAGNGIPWTSLVLAHSMANCELISLRVKYDGMSYI